MLLHQICSCNMRVWCRATGRSMAPYSPMSRADLVQNQTVFGPSIGIHAEVNDVSCLHPSLLLHGSMEYLVSFNVMHSTAQHSTAQHITSQHSAAQCSVVQCSILPYIICLYYTSCVACNLHITVPGLLPFRMLSNSLFMIVHHARVKSITCFVQLQGR